MKSVVRLIMAALLMVMVSATATAQTTDTKKADRPRFNPEQFVEMRAKQIAQQLALDDATTAKFVKDYSDYQKEVFALRPNFRQQETTDANAADKTKERLERSRKLLDLQEKYNKSYSSYLTAKQIERVHEIEKETMSKFGKGRGSKNASGDQPLVNPLRQSEQ